MSQSELPFSDDRDVYSVSRLTTEVRYALERGFPLLWVQGEISGLSTPASGHAYFTLKDVAAQVRCALFRAKRARLRHQPKEGQEVIVRARISFYEARGDFQLIIEQMEPAGEGALRQALEQLKQKLAAEGLFDRERKKALPPYPKRIGIITSPSGAAIRDVLTVLKRRYAAADIVIYPIPVQGKEAPVEIVEMLKLADGRNECDLLILTRGGGSLEDLMAFNDEGVARALARMTIPVVSAVGHEIDFTLADLAADRRAPTPSAAAELVSPDRDELLHKIDALHQRIGRRLAHQLQQLRSRIDAAGRRLELIHPSRNLQQKQQRLDELTLRMERTVQGKLERLHSRLNNSKGRLQLQHPQHRLEQYRHTLEKLEPRLKQGIKRELDNKQHAIAAIAGRLNIVSPLATLERGYAIAWKMPEKTIVRSAGEVSEGDQLEIRVANGTIKTKVQP